jgi:hypothetical protein
MKSPKYSEGRAFGEASSGHGPTRSIKHSALQKIRGLLLVNAGRQSDKAMVPSRLHL